MNRIDILQQRLFDVMPTPQPVLGGPRVGRTRIYAAAVAGNPIATVSGRPIYGLEAQQGCLISQMNQGASLQRVDLTLPGGSVVSAGSWDPTLSAFWTFQPATTIAPGATGVFLDWWGRMLQVPRALGGAELDAPYAKRMLTEAFAPGVTNYGLAALIDTLLWPGGAPSPGTSVEEGAGFFWEPRWNQSATPPSGPHRRLNGGWRLGFAYPWATFLVRLPAEIPAGFSPGDINTLVARKKAAGFRKMTTLTPFASYND